MKIFNYCIKKELLTTVQFNRPISKKGNQLKKIINNKIKYLKIIIPRD